MGPTMNYPNRTQYPTIYQNGSYSQGNSIPQQPYPDQNYTPYSTMSPIRLGINWVDGEVGAKAFPLPAGWPANAPIDLWDTNDCVIYLKSVNQFGMPNPLQKVHYTMDEPQQQSNLMAGANSEYATKEDMRNMEERIISHLSGDRRTSQAQGRNGGGKE